MPGSGCAARGGPWPDRPADAEPATSGHSGSQAATCENMAVPGRPAGRTAPAAFSFGGGPGLYR